MDKPIKVTRLDRGQYRIIAADGSSWKVIHPAWHGQKGSFGWVGYDEANQHASDRLPSLSAWKDFLSQVRS